MSDSESPKPAKAKSAASKAQSKATVSKSAAAPGASKAASKPSTRAAAPKAAPASAAQPTAPKLPGAEPEAAPIPPRNRHERRSAGKKRPGQAPFKWPPIGPERP